MDFGRQPAGAYTRVIEDRIGRGKRARKIRRPFFFERHTDRILELQTAYIDLEFGLASLNAQIAVLADLKVLQAWCALRKIQDPRWSEPQVRAAADKMPMTEKEVKDFSRWCQRNAGSLTEDIRLDVLAPTPI